MEHEERGDASAALSDLTRWIAILAAPHGYVATARLLERINGDRLLLQARSRAVSGDACVREVSLETLVALRAVGVATAFDRAVRAALASAETTEPAVTPEQG